jgi:septum formation protein
MQNPSLILASTSKIRGTILKNAGLDFTPCQPLLDEDRAKALLGSATPKDVATTLAEQKALSLAKSGDLIIGADQTLSCEGVLYNKPNLINQAHQHLLALRGKTHTLHSAVAIAQQGKIIWSICEDAQLTMRKFSDEFAASYIEKSGPTLMHTVGAYQLENRGAQLFDHIKGDYFTILGLPLLPLLAFLRHIKFIES